MTGKFLRTPLIKPREQSGTFYTFGSAMEDIGLNINELHNKVALSHYVLLDIPEFNSSTGFDTKADAESYQSEEVNVGDYMFAEGFENYVLNLETLMRNRKEYDFSMSKTVSERAFWKWMSSAMDLQKDPSSNYYIDNNTIAKGFGLINSGAQRSDDYSMYNETFVQIPSSFGQMKVLYKISQDNNYYVRTEPFVSNSSTGFIENIQSDEVDPVTNKLHTGINANAIYDDGVDLGYSISEVKDSLEVELSIDKLRQYYDSDSLSFDDLAIDENYLYNNSNNDFEFNSILIYYSIYDSTGKNILATNAYGILILNNAEEESDTYRFPGVVKKQSTGAKSGISYSFRLNVKTTSVYSGDVVVTDNSSPAYSMSTDFNDVIKNLNTAIEHLRSNANLIAVINSENSAIKKLAISAMDKVDDLEKTINQLKSGTKDIILNEAALHSYDTSFEFYSDNSQVGAIYNGTLSFENIFSNNLEGNDCELKNVKVESLNGIGGNDILINSNIDSSNNISSKNIFVNQSAVGTLINPADVDTILSGLTCYFDDATQEYSIEAGSSAGSLVRKNDYIDIKGLLALIIAKLKQ